MTLTATPASVGIGGTFTLTLTDPTPAANYTLSGVPTGWTISGATTVALSVNPPIYQVPAAALLGGLLKIKAPAGFTGTLPDVTVGRASGTTNLITAFNNGTFDYIGTAAPTLPAGSTQYAWHDPRTLTSAASTVCQPRQYAPCDGEYSIWPTGNMNGPGTTNFNNYWADLRSSTFPMITPTTTDICGLADPATYWTNGPLSTTTRMVSNSESANAGKFLIVNGSTALPVPNNVLTTTVTGLVPGGVYSFSGLLANLESNNFFNPNTLPVSTQFFANGTLVTTSQTLAKHGDCRNQSTKWTQTVGLVTADAAGQVKIDVRNNVAGGFGNDLAVDELKLFPLAAVSVNLVVVATAAYTVQKSSSPASGTTVAANGLVTYTVTVRNTGDIAYTAAAPASFADDLSDVLDDATLEGSPTTTAGAVTVSGTTLNWSGPIPLGGTVTVKYTVRVKTPVVPGEKLHNVVSPTAPTGTCVVNACETTHPLLVPTTLTILKDLPNGRAAVGDQFRLRGFTWATGDSGAAAQALGAAVDTASIKNGIQDARFGPVTVTPGQQIRVQEEFLPAARRSDYTTALACTYKNAAGTDVPVTSTLTNSPTAGVRYGRLTIPTAPAGINVVCTFTNTPPVMGIDIVKKDASTGATLAGATFQLWRDLNGNSEWDATDEQVGAERTTDATGILDYTPLGAGHYFLQEVSLPEGYEPAVDAEDGIYDLGSLGPATLHISREILNVRALGTVVWQKTDDHEQHLNGSEWELSGPSGIELAVTDCIAADATGCASGPDADHHAGQFRVDGLVWGDWKLSETKAPTGYTLTDQTFEFTVDGTAAELEFDAGAFINHPRTVPQIPLTGGLGEDWILLSGAGLSALFLCLLIIRWRRSNALRSLPSPSTTHSLRFTDERK